MSLPSITGENRPRELLFIQGFVSLTVLDDEDSPIEEQGTSGAQQKDKGPSLQGSVRSQNLLELVYHQDLTRCRRFISFRKMFSPLGLLSGGAWLLESVFE